MAELTDVTAVQALSGDPEKKDVKAIAAAEITTPPSSVGGADEDQQKTYGRVARVRRAIQRYVWDDPNKPKREKLFLFKLDLFLLSATCLGYFCKNLAQVRRRCVIRKAMVADILIRQTSTMPMSVACVKVGGSLSKHPYTLKPEC